MSRPSLAPDPLRAGRAGLRRAPGRALEGLHEATDGEAERPRPVEVGEVRGAPQSHPASVLGGAREGSRTVRRKSGSHSPLRMSVGPGYAARRGCEALPDDGPQGLRAAGRPEAAGDDRLGDGRGEAGPEEPGVERIERRPVEPIHDPGEGEKRRRERGRRVRRSRRTGPGRGRAPADEPPGPSRRSRRATGRRRPRARRPAVLDDVAPPRRPRPRR